MNDNDDRTPDITVKGEGFTTIYQFEAKTDDAMEWIKQNVVIPEYMWLGSRRFIVEHRYMPPIVAGMIENGFNVLHENTRLYCCITEAGYISVGNALFRG